MVIVAFGLVQKINSVINFTISPPMKPKYSLMFGCKRTHTVIQFVVWFHSVLVYRSVHSYKVNEKWTINRAKLLRAMVFAFTVRVWRQALSSHLAARQQSAFFLCVYINMKKSWRLYLFKGTDENVKVSWTWVNHLLQPSKCLWRKVCCCYCTDLQLLVLIIHTEDCNLLQSGCSDQMPSTLLQEISWIQTVKLFVMWLRAESTVAVNCAILTHNSTVEGQKNRQ